ncbi:hypothetical protein K456DRAFT_1507096 [Colletotrichum gloeosporioides 23]|nr:hypothetical protein K456DRAFT_1507096 [Colletotrichum gloeosporioides 23]
MELSGREGPFPRELCGPPWAAVAGHAGPVSADFSTSAANDGRPWVVCSKLQAPEAALSEDSKGHSCRYNAGRATRKTTDWQWFLAVTRILSEFPLSSGSANSRKAHRLWGPSPGGPAGPPSRRWLRSEWVSRRVQ